MKFRLGLVSVFLAIATQSGSVGAQDEPSGSTTLSPLKTGFSLRLPPTELVSFHGIVSYDAAGSSSAQIIYPAPGIAGLLVAIATHGAIVESAKSLEKEKLRQAADKVLDSYRPVLQSFSNNELVTRGIAAMHSGGEKTVLSAGTESHAGWIVATSPIFWLAQDQTALILENTVQVISPTLPGRPQFQVMVKVVSKAHTDPDMGQTWIAENGKQLKQESVDMFEHSLTLALEDVARGPVVGNSSQKTFRYNEGDIPKAERAQLVQELCDRAVVRTLRGSLLSIPNHKAGAESDNRCKALGQNAQ